MTVYLTNRDGNGKTNEEGHYRLVSKILSGQVMTANDLKVIENTTPNMSVIVQAGDYRLMTSAGYAYTGWIDVDTNVTVSAADPSNPRKTVIVLYVDKGATTSASPPNNPGIAKLMAVNGAAAGSPTVPSNAAIQTAVGSGNPFMILGTIDIGAAASTITNSNITDNRTEITISDELLSASSLLAQVGPLLYPVGSIYTNATSNVNPGTLLGFGTWTAFGQGRVPVGIDTGDTDFGAPGNTGGAKTVTLTEAQMPQHSHVVNPPATTTSAGGQHRHSIGNVGSWGVFGLRDSQYASSSGTGYTSFDGNHNHTVNIPQFDSGTRGSSQSHTNLQPYVVVYMWRRVS